MAKLVVLWHADATVRIGQEEAKRLGAMGITSLSLLRDGTTLGVVLEGWAFDPVRFGAAAAATLSAQPPIGSLAPTLEIAVASAAMQGGQDDSIPTHPGRDSRGRSSAGA